MLIAWLTLGACAKPPSSTARENNTQCTLEMETARTAVRLRDQGLAKSRLANQLPAVQPASSRLLKQMHVILAEVYAYPDLNEVIYATYRFQHCIRAMQGRPVPNDLSRVHTPLLSCQTQYGEQASVAGTQCILDLLQNFQHDT